VSIGRRDFTKLSGATIFATLAGCAGEPRQSKKETKMYGLIGKMTCVPGQRDAFTAILLEGTAAMPGCLSYVIARDPQDANALWITEVWDSKESHAASLQLPAVRDSIKRGRPLIVSFGEQTITEPVGGFGLPKAR
jgi:quinol monooxygenase YgiN